MLPKFVGCVTYRRDPEVLEMGHDVERGVPTVAAGAHPNVAAVRGRMSVRNIFMRSNQPMSWRW